MAYRYLATSVPAFIQQLAVSYVGHGYFFYVTGHIPEGKDPKKTDEKILNQYEIAVSKWAKARRKRRGAANLHYLRLERFFVIVSTHGEHSFFERETKNIKDIRRAPMKFAGYSVSFRQGQGRGHPSVRMERSRYLEFKTYFENIATKRPLERVSAELHALPFEPYAPVRNQFLNILRAINRKRRAAGMEPVPLSAVRLRRSPVKVFERAKDGFDGEGEDRSSERLLCSIAAQPVHGRRAEKAETDVSAKDSSSPQGEEPSLPNGPPQ